MNEFSTEAFDPAWLPEDFVNEEHIAPKEYDPWSDIPVGKQDDNINSEQDAASMPQQEPSLEQPQIPQDNSVADFDSAHIEIGDIENANSVDGVFPDFYEGYGEYFDSGEYVDELIEWDEPEPVVEYEDGLSEDLNVADFDLPDFSRRLKIDEFVSSVSSTNDYQSRQISELLEEISSRRLTRWLVWLQEQEWTGRTLLLFLDFRLNYWEQCPDWWGHTFWHYKYGEWWTASMESFYSLSRDATYELVHFRLEHSASGVIDDAWLEDWEDYSLWKYGFPTFASIALLRASLIDGDDWRNYLSEYSSFDLPEQSASSHLYHANDRGDAEPILAVLDGQYRIWEARLPYRNLRNGSEWFAIQEWYDPDEWHGGLGWSHGSCENLDVHVHGTNDQTSPYQDAPYR